MGVWEFVVVYLVVFVLLQFAVYRYLRRGDDGTPHALGHLPNAEPGGVDERSADGRRARGRSGDLPADGLDGDVRRCPRCGAANEGDQEFTFCRNCAGRLGS